MDKIKKKKIEYIVIITDYDDHRNGKQNYYDKDESKRRRMPWRNSSK